MQRFWILILLLVVSPLSAKQGTAFLIVNDRYATPGSTGHIIVKSVSFDRYPGRSEEKIYRDPHTAFFTEQEGEKKYMAVRNLPAFDHVVIKRMTIENKGKIHYLCLNANQILRLHPEQHVSVSQYQKAGRDVFTCEIEKNKFYQGVNTLG